MTNKTTERPPASINGIRNPDYWNWYNKTESAKAAQQRYQQSDKARITRSRRETPEQFAERIMSGLHEGPESLLEASDCPIEAAAPIRPSIDTIEHLACLGMQRYGTSV